MPFFLCCPYPSSFSGKKRRDLPEVLGTCSLSVSRRNRGCFPVLKEGRDGEFSTMEEGMGHFLLEEFFSEAGMVVEER